MTAPTLTPPAAADGLDALLALVGELLDDHCRLYHHAHLNGKPPRLNDAAYSLDLRQRVLGAVAAAEMETER